MFTKILTFILIAMLLVGCVNSQIAGTNSNADTTTMPTTAELTSAVSVYVHDATDFHDYSSIEFGNINDIHNEDVIVRRQEFNDDMLLINHNEKMDLFSRANFEMNGESASIELYVSRFWIHEGKFVPAETCHDALLLVRQNNYAYRLIFSREQRGEIRAYVRFNYENQISVIVFIATQTGISIYEYKYDSDKQAFIKEDIFILSGGFQHMWEAWQFS